jgi:hypothetical protein
MAIQGREVGNAGLVELLKRLLVHEGHAKLQVDRCGDSDKPQEYQYQ